MYGLSHWFHVAARRIENEVVAWIAKCSAKGGRRDLETQVAVSCTSTWGLGIQKSNPEGFVYWGLSSTIPVLLNSEPSPSEISKTHQKENTEKGRETTWVSGAGIFHGTIAWAGVEQCHARSATHGRSPGLSAAGGRVTVNSSKDSAKILPSLWQVGCLPGATPHILAPNWAF